MRGASIAFIGAKVISMDRRFQQKILSVVALIVIFWTFLTFGTLGVSESRGADSDHHKSVDLTLSNATKTTEPALDLRDLIQEAIDHNPALKASKFEAIAKEAEIAPKGSYEDPMLEFEAMNYPADTLSPREFGMTGNQWSLIQKIQFPGKLTKLKNAAGFEYRAKQQSFNAKQLQLIKDIKVAFFELYLAQKKQEILLERRNVIEQLIVVTRNKYTLGKATQAEIISMQVEEANLTGQLISNEKLIENKRTELGAMLGRDIPTVSGNALNFEKTKVDLSKLNEQELAKRVIAKSPTLKGAEAELSASESKLSYARWNYLPDFQFTLRYTSRQPSMGDRGVDLVSGGVGINIPIWIFSKQSEESKAAAAEHIRADAMLTEQRIELKKSIHNIWTDLNEAHKKVLLFQTALLPLAKQAVTTGRSAYLAGKLEYVSLLNFINTRYQTELDYNEALVNCETKLAEIEALAGEPIGVANES